jgi:hypothetical protein
MKQQCTYEQLLEKIIRVKIKLETCKVIHHKSCLFELDPDSACSCGAFQHNQSIESALRELKL